MSERLFWDIFLDGRWIGMSAGDSFIDAVKLVRRSLPKIHRRIKYRRWYGRWHEKNCKISGGRIANPT